MDWKDVVKGIAPTIGGLLAATGPVGMLAGAGITAVANALGVPASGDPVIDGANIQRKIEFGLSPEDRMALVAADTEIKKAMISAGIREKELTVESEKNVIMDVADARDHNANTVGILRLGYLINVASYVCVFLVLYGCYTLISGKFKDVDPGLAATIGTLVGAVVQWMMANAAHANGFFFGSSPSSRASSQALAASVTKAATTTIESKK